MAARFPAKRVTVETTPLRRRVRDCRVRRGLSLLELVLALSISVIVLGLLSMAVRFQMHTFEKRRDRIEEAQLARAILRSIANDLHSAVAYRPIDLQGVEEVTGNSAQSAGGVVNSGAIMGASGAGVGSPMGASGGAASGTTGAGGAGPGTTQLGATTATNGSSNGSQAGGATTGGGQASNGGPASNSSGQNGNASGGSNASKTGSTGQSFGSSSSGTNYSGTSTSSTSSTGSSGGSLNGSGDTQTSETGEASYVAGLYGDASTLTFDISRLPRVDEYQSFVSRNANDPMAKIPSDVRTVSYYLQDAVPLSASSSAALPPGAAKPLRSAQQNQMAGMGLTSQGLMRQERDRAVASYSNTSASLASTSGDSGEEKLAEEVTRLEFRYFDGYEWWPEWDSDDRGGLPVAIEVVIGMPDRKLDSAKSSPTAPSGSNNSPQELYYRLVVRIPTGEAMASSEMGTEQPTNDASSGSGSQNAGNQSSSNAGKGTSGGASGAGTSSGSGASGNFGGGS